MKEFRLVSPFFALTPESETCKKFGLSIGILGILCEK